MKCRAETQYPRGLRFPVPLDKGNEGSGNEIARYKIESDLDRVSPSSSRAQPQRMMGQMGQIKNDGSDKNRYAMRTCVCYLEIIVGYVVLSCTVQNVGFVGFVWCHVCFAALKINETVGKKKLKSLKDKVSCL